MRSDKKVVLWHVSAILWYVRVHKEGNKLVEGKLGILCRDQRKSSEIRE